MNIIIGKEENTLFEKGAIYDCVIKGEINEQLYYKVYGDEFTLSCTEKEFHQNFLIIKHKKTNEGSRNFEFYKKFNKWYKIPFNLLDKTIIDFRTNPKHRVDIT